MAALAADFEGNKDSVIEMLIGNVMNVNIDIPRVVKGDFEDEKWMNAGNTHHIS